jgi:hypothetical protein
MPKLNAKLLLGILKDAGVEISDEIAKKVAKDVDEQIKLELAESTPGEGQLIVEEEEWQKRGKDLAKLRKRTHDAEERVKELEGSLEAGESHLKKENKILRDKLEKIEPLQKTLLEAKRKEWDGLAKKIPEELQKKLHWPDKEDQQISDEQVLENLSNLNDWRDLKVPGVPGVEASGDGDGDDGDGGPTGLPKSSPTGKHQKGTPGNLSEMNPSQLMEAGYEQSAKKG